MNDLTQVRLKEVLDYDPITGIFRRRESRSNRIKSGAITGAKPVARGYALIHIDGRRYYAHRLAWLYVHGQWPDAEIDHINRNRLDNRLANLRQATRAQNNANRPTRASSGYRGAYWCKGRFIASVTVGGKSFNLGSFQRPVDAHAAYLASAVKHHGEFTAGIVAAEALVAKANEGVRECLDRDLPTQRQRSSGKE